MIQYGKFGDLSDSNVACRVGYEKTWFLTILYESTKLEDPFSHFVGFLSSGTQMTRHAKLRTVDAFYSIWMMLNG